MINTKQPNVLGMVASPDPRGRTQDVVRRALDGAAAGGLATELIYLGDFASKPCRDCRPWNCRTTKRCRLDEDGHFAYLSTRFLAADAVVFGSPVYYGIASESANAFFQRMHRIWAGRAAGVPALGVAVAGGTGGGLLSGLKPIYHFFRMMGMRGIEGLPVTRFNSEPALEQAFDLGGKLVERMRDRQPFAGLEALAWYDDLPYLSASLVEERVFLVEQVAASLEDRDSLEACACREALADAKRLLEAGRRGAALPLIDLAYSEGLKAFEAPKALSVG